MLIYDVLHKEKVYHSVANDLRTFGVKYRFKKSMFKSERPEACRDISKRVFKTPLFYQPLDIVNLSSGGIVHVPVFVTQASTFLERYITQEGLFRKAGSQARQKELMHRLDNGGTLGEKNHAIDVANCLKSFFRDLPVPLIPYTYHDLFIHCALLKSYRIQALLLACTLLPPYHLNTLAFFMDFLKRVSMHEKQNKMSIENLAKVVAPNIMPLQDTTMSAVQNRLQMHLAIVKILIENSQDIGILPPHIARSVSTEANGSTDTGLDSFELHGKSKKKKHRSGSLTRMFNGLKKIVGKGTDDTTISYQQPSVPTVQIPPSKSNMPPNKFSKKRKVTERGDPANIKKKKMIDKSDKSKKLRLSLDKFVPKNKQKDIDSDSPDSYTNNYKCTERRWSSVSNSFEARKIHKYSNEISHFQLMKDDKLSNNDFQQEYDNVFIDADVNLSDNGSEQDLLMNKNHNKIDEQWKINVKTNSRKSKTIDGSDDICSSMSEKKANTKDLDTSIPDTNTSLLNDHCDDYVRISKSEYEEIKNRVSAIESRISQEFGSIYNEENEDITAHSVNKVQTAYEKTLEEASIENTLTSDYLAKKLSKELKIRRSGEHKIIRSPSARKIGTLRRRSQEKVTSKRIRRTASWHITPEFNLQHHNQLEKQINVYPTEKQSAFTSKYSEEQPTTRYNRIISNNTRSEIIYLRNQMNTLISHSKIQHNTSDNNDPNFSEIKNMHLTNNYMNSPVRRASSFHGKDFLDSPLYFNEKKEDLKKTNSHQNIVLNNDYLQRGNTVSEVSKEISWKDADGYFKSGFRINTPAPQTGRASVAKLRAQNAGMVLAKAKLFDECTVKTSELVSTKISNKKPNCDNVNNKHASQATKQMDINTEHPKQSCTRIQISRKQSNKDLKNKNCHTSPQVRTQILNISSKPLQKQIESNYHSAHEFDVQDQKVLNKDPITYHIADKNKTINITRDIEISQKENIATKIRTSNTEIQNPNMFVCKLDVNRTPHIKRPLSVKTPKSSKSLMRKIPVDTRRTPLKATAQLGTPKRHSPRSILKTKTLSMHA